MLTITATELRALGACKGQVREFEARFGASVSFASETDLIAAAVSVADAFNWDWAAHSMLPAPARAAYRAATASAWAAYQAAAASAWAAYRVAKAPAWAAYEAVMASAWAAYRVAKAPAFASALWRARVETSEQE